MKRELQALSILWLIIATLSGCTYNPFTTNNETTGSPAGAAIGAVAAGGGIALFTSSKPVIAVMGLGGGMLGYYVTTLRSDAAAILKADGQVYKVGDTIGIYIPTDNLFEANTADLLPQAGAILESAATVLGRYPKNNIIISGNTSGFGRARWEQRLSEERAKRIAAYLWSLGLNYFQGNSTDIRRLNYVGYGDYFPIATNMTNDGLRMNSRIQITSYPTNCNLHLDPRTASMNNMGGTDDSWADRPSVNRCNNSDEFC